MQKLVKISFIECEADKSHLWSILRKHLDAKHLVPLKKIWDESEGLNLLKNVYSHCYPSEPMEIETLQKASTIYSIFKAYIEVWKLADRWVLNEVALKEEQCPLIEPAMNKINETYPSLFMYKDKSDDFFEYLVVIKDGKFTSKESGDIIFYIENMIKTSEIE